MILILYLIILNKKVKNIIFKFKYWKDNPEKYKEKLKIKKRFSSNTTEALSLSPAMAPKRTQLQKYSHSLTTNQLLAAVQQNAQKISN